jgi:hypothetical protein
MHVAPHAARRAGRSAALALLAAVLAAAAVPAQAETPAERAACAPSVLQLCPRAALMLDRQGALQCLLANLDRAAPQCQAVVRGRLALMASRPQPTAVRPPR